MFSSWLRKLTQRGNKKTRRGHATTTRRKASRPLQIEALEDRYVPAPLYTWTGLDGTNNQSWGRGNNWKDQGGNPGVPTPGAILLFDSTAASFNSHDDIPGASTFSSLTISAGASYSIDGAGGTSLSNTTVSVTGNAGDVDFFSLALSGTSSVTKSGAGELDLFGSNTYTGNTIMSGGTLLVNGADAFGTGRLFFQERNVGR